MIFKARSEIEDLMWLDVNPSKGQNTSLEYNFAEKHVIPVGYQPFSRCKAQHAYMLLGVTDLYMDEQFDKAKFRLNEEFCRWIYEEMDKGKKIYPAADVPDVSSYVGKIARTKFFSKSVFDYYCELKKYDVKAKKRLKDNLIRAGYFVSEKELSFISQEEIESINKSYTLEDAYRIAGVQPLAKPIMIL